MEKLDGSLDDLIETVPNISLILKTSILEDVARGLLYLHKHDPPIVHRDLTAKNVLLTSSLVAKVTDFGNSRTVSIQPDHLSQTMSQNPGTQLGHILVWSSWNRCRITSMFTVIIKTWTVA